ncbi:PIN domain-containing protein [Belliella sp. DSM 107340]|uniref:PIN domain-containing protein n=1 Tax=Belliella calami TaxID=2923436 RepID=A0ABS9UMS8_9BACT|nr:PIN domain-containing protein [Belliella calami]MCH7397872.1 PIN domain-containing protein [Belliella calami]
MAVIHRLQDFALLNDRDIFVDANVLIYLFWPTGQHHFERNYARVFGNLLRRGNSLYVDFLVISEIVNRAIRAEYEKYLLTNSMTKSQLNFKDYRNSQDGQDSLNDIYIIVNSDILGNFKVVEKPFNKNNIKNLLVVDELDFIDKALVSICTEHNLVLLTNDRDFKNSGLDILTGNPNILG